MNKDRVLIIGLDGATWRILGPLMDKGVMPALRKLVRRDACGTLKSTIPPVTAPAWASFQTGVNPGKHGIYDFQAYDPVARKTVLVDSRALKLRTMWDIAIEKGKKVITVNVPLTYPPRRVKGRITVGCMLSPREDERFVYPREIFRYVRRLDYKILPGFIGRGVFSGVENFLGECREVERRRFELAGCLMEDYDWDIFMVHNQCMDAIQHCFYPYLDPVAPKFREDEYSILSEFYRASDSYINEILKKIDNGTMVILLSDHGSTGVEKYVNLNLWLMRHGYLKTERRSVMANMLLYLRRLDRYKLRHRVLNRFLRNSLPLVKLRTNLSLNTIDHERTQAFIPLGATYGGIYMNGGISREKIKDELLELRDPENNSRVIKEVFYKEDVFSGKFVEALPDLMVEPCPGYTLGPQLLGEDKILRRARPGYDLLGTHDMDGVIVLSNGDAKGGVIENASIMDIAPTVLSCLDIQVPRWVDGNGLYLCWKMK